MRPPDRVEWVGAVEMAEVAEALGIDTAEVMAVHSDGVVLFSTETLTADDPPLWAATLGRDADGIVIASPRKQIGTMASFHAEMRALMERAQKDLDLMEPVIIVTDHAMWRAAKVPRFDTVRIEDEVRAALKEGRMHAERAHLGLRPTADPRSLYVWTPDGLRIYALRHDDEAFTVTTTMRPKEMP